MRRGTGARPLAAASRGAAGRTGRRGDTSLGLAGPVPGHGNQTTIEDAEGSAQTTETANRKDQQQENGGTDKGDLFSDEVDIGFKFKFNLVGSCRKYHAPEDIIHAEMRGRPAVDKSIPAFRVVYFREYGKAVILRAV